MQVHVLFFAQLRQEAGLAELTLEVPSGATVRTVAEQLQRERGLSLSGCMVAVNEVYASPEQPLCPGDEVAFLPPVAGGQGNPDPSFSDSDTHLEITAHTLDLAPAQAFLVRPEYGAQAYFVGTVRSPNQGQEVAYIDYEAFAPMAQKVLWQLTTQAREQWGQLRVWVQHRTGRLAPAEASILIGVASPHRRAALEACDFLIEQIKKELPVWKHESADGQERWVAGQSTHETL